MTAKLIGGPADGQTVFNYEPAASCHRVRWQEIVYTYSPSDDDPHVLLFDGGAELASAEAVEDFLREFDRYVARCEELGVTP